MKPGPGFYAKSGSKSIYKKLKKFAAEKIVFFT
jgi:hypothetical protein